MASTDATAYPIKNAAWRVTFPILDADGDLVTGATGLDSEVSKDGGTFADCTNEATEIATSSGVYYLDLTSTEMNADTVAIIVKTSSSGAKTTTIVTYPDDGTRNRVDVRRWTGTAVATPDTAGYPKVTVKAGTGTGEVSLASGAVTVGTNNDKTGYRLSATGVDDVWDEARSGHVAAGSFGEGVASVQGNVTGSVGSVSGAVGSVTGAVGSVTGAVGSVTGNVGGNVTGSVGSLAAQAKADVNAEVVDALNTDTYAEPGQGAPAATATLAAKIGYLYKAWRNLKTQTADTWTLYNDDGTTAGQKSTVSDDGTTATRGEVATGA